MRARVSQNFSHFAAFSLARRRFLNAAAAKAVRTDAAEESKPDGPSHHAGGAAVARRSTASLSNASASMYAVIQQHRKQSELGEGRTNGTKRDSGWKRVFAIGRRSAAARVIQTFVRSVWQRRHFRQLVCLAKFKFHSACRTVTRVARG
jgi:hypothetical protein